MSGSQKGLIELKVEANMQVEVEDNPNCERCDQMVYQELEPAKPIRGIRVFEGSQEFDCEVVGMNEGGKPVQAYAMKITDSGAAYAYLIYGGSWGIRLRPEKYTKEPWDFSNKNQWGEPYKIYGEKADILYQ